MAANEIEVTWQPRDLSVRRFNQLKQHQQALATAKATQKVWAEAQAAVLGEGKFPYSGEDYEREDTEKAFNEALQPWAGEVADKRFWDEIGRSSTIRRIVAEEASRRVHRQRFVVVPSDVTVLVDD